MKKSIGGFQTQAKGSRKEYTQQSAGTTGTGGPSSKFSNRGGKKEYAQASAGTGKK